MTGTSVLRPPPAAARHARPTRVVVPLLVVAAGFAVAVVTTVVAYSQARHSTGNSFFTLFWAGWLVGVGVTVWAGTRRHAPPWLSMAVLVGYAVLNFVPKFLLSPARAYYFDEFGHWQQVQQIVATGDLRPVNTYQPIIRNFPGLEWTTALVHVVTRLPVWHAGQVVVLAAHVCALLAVRGIARVMGAGPRVAFVAAMLYSFNPNYQFFDTEYGYESLGLTLALVATYAALRVQRAATPGAAWRWAGATVLAAAATVVTHHLSSFLAVFVCVVVALTGRVRRPADGTPEADVAPTRDRFRAGLTAALAGVVVLVAWIVFVARTLDAYLGPHVTPAFGQLYDHFFGDDGGSDTGGGGAAVAPGSRTLFEGSLAPHYEQYFAYAAPVLLLLLCLAGLWTLRRERRLQWLWVTPVFLAAIFFVSLPFALTVAGSEGTHRSWGYSFLGISLLAASGLSAASRLVARLPAGRLIGPVAAAVAVATILVGETTVGVNTYFRFPNPPTFGEDTRGTSHATVAVARWMARHVPARSHVVTDRYTGESITGYSSLLVPAPDQATAFQIYRFGNDPTPQLRDYLEAHDFRYFVLDTRILREPPLGKFFPTYDFGPSVNLPAMRRLGGSDFAQLIYSRGVYRVFRIDP